MTSRLAATAAGRVEAQPVRFPGLADQARAELTAAARDVTFYYRRGGVLPPPTAGGWDLLFSNYVTETPPPPTPGPVAPITLADIRRFIDRLENPTHRWEVMVRDEDDRPVPLVAVIGNWYARAFDDEEFGLAVYRRVQRATLEAVPVEPGGFW